MHTLVYPYYFLLNSLTNVLKLLLLTLYYNSRLLQLHPEPSNLCDDQPGVQGGIHPHLQEGLLLPQQQGYQ